MGNKTFQSIQSMATLSTSSYWMPVSSRSLGKPVSTSPLIFLIHCRFSLCPSISDDYAHKVDKLLHFLNQLSSNHLWSFALCTSYSHRLVFSIRLPDLCVQADCLLANTLVSADEDSVFQLWSGSWSLIRQPVRINYKIDAYQTSDSVY